FNYISSKVPPNSYFTIVDSDQTEYSHDTIFAKSKIIWTSCNEYFLILKESRIVGLNQGDTAYISLLSAKDDTISYVSTFHRVRDYHKVLKAD
ncbi:MAG: hypothetical protein ACJ75B_03570, partial [Flavisolibacter sp.]